MCTYAPCWDSAVYLRGTQMIASVLLVDIVAVHVYSLMNLVTLCIPELDEARRNEPEGHILQRARGVDAISTGASVSCTFASNRVALSFALVSNRFASSYDDVCLTCLLAHVLPFGWYHDLRRVACRTRWGL